MSGSERIRLETRPLRKQPQRSDERVKLALSGCKAEQNSSLTDEFWSAPRRFSVLHVMSDARGIAILVGTFC